MSRPAIAGVMSSGWHVHQSLTELDGPTQRRSPATRGCRDLGRRYLAGLLAHARGAAVFTTPTVNGYKRYRPISLAPDRILWGEDNKGAMVRVGRRTRRAHGWRTGRASPPRTRTSTIAAQVVSGLDGVDRGLDPGEPTTAPYAEEAARLPGSLVEALDALDADPVFARRSAREVVAWITTLKRAEVDPLPAGGLRLGAARVLRPPVVDG